MYHFSVDLKYEHKIKKKKKQQTFAKHHTKKKQFPFCVVCVCFFLLNILFFFTGVANFTLLVKEKCMGSIFTIIQCNNVYEAKNYIILYIVWMSIYVCIFLATYYFMYGCRYIAKRKKKTENKAVMSLVRKCVGIVTVNILMYKVHSSCKQHQYDTDNGISNTTLSVGNSLNIFSFSFKTWYIPFQYTTNIHLLTEGFMSILTCVSLKMLHGF